MYFIFRHGSSPDSGPEETYNNKTLGPPEEFTDNKELVEGKGDSSIPESNIQNGKTKKKLNNLKNAIYDCTYQYFKVKVCKFTGGITNGYVCLAESQKALTYQYKNSVKIDMTLREFFFN